LLWNHYAEGFVTTLSPGAKRAGINLASRYVLP
jgi:hypothetical protein